MDNITLIEVDSIGVVETHVVIDHGNGKFTSMLKTAYDEMIAQQEAAKPLL
jgi:hypothetical protein